MSVSYTYRRSHLKKGGIILTLLCSFIFISIIIFLNGYAKSKNFQFTEEFYALLMIWPMFIGFGIYLIIRGRSLFEFQFGETNFKFYKNSTLEIDVPVEQIKSVYITHEFQFNMMAPSYDYKKIKIGTIGKKEVKLTIRGKKWIRRFLIFTLLLELYCSKKQIHFKEIHNDYLGY